MRRTSEQQKTSERHLYASYASDASPYPNEVTGTRDAQDKFVAKDSIAISSGSPHLKDRRGGEGGGRALASWLAGWLSTGSSDWHEPRHHLRVGAIGKMKWRPLRSVE